MEYCSTPIAYPAICEEGGARQIWQSYGTGMDCTGKKNAVVLASGFLYY